jgi:hypothetical protein
MTSPVTKIEVECPRCASVYEDWYRASINLGLDDFDDEYLRKAATATCPTCGHVIELETLVVEHGVWRWGTGTAPEQNRQNAT